ncbi:MAG: pilus assembly PilX N-terminal domain-containing protein [Patescibacteria group bacterium]
MLGEIRLKLNKKLDKVRPGSALLLTMFILAGMLIVAMSGAYITLLGIQASGIQSQSTKAYFAAEAGAENLLWFLRRNGWEYNDPSETPIFEGTMPVSRAGYNVYFTAFPPLKFSAIGEYNKTKRSVEIIIGN